MYVCEFQDQSVIALWNMNGNKNEISGLFVRVLMVMYYERDSDT